MKKTIAPLLFSLLSITTAISCNEPDKVYDVHGNCYHKDAYTSTDETSLEFLSMKLDLGRSHLLKKEYIDAMIHYNYICFTLVPKNKVVFDEAKNMNDETLFLFCDALQGRLACAYGLGIASDPRHRDERAVLQKIDKRIPKYDEITNLYTLDYALEEEEIQEFIASMKDLELIEKSSDVQRLPTGGVQFKVIDKKPCCAPCGEGKECDDEKKSLN